MASKLQLFSGTTEQIENHPYTEGALYIDISGERVMVGGGSNGGAEYDDSEIKASIEALQKKDTEQDVNITYVQEQIAEINTSIEDMDGEIDLLNENIEGVASNVATLTSNVANDAERITALEQKPEPKDWTEEVSALQAKDTEIDGTLSTLGDLATIDKDGNANHFLNGEGEWVDAPAGSGSSGGSGDCIQTESFGEVVGYVGANINSTNNKINTIFSNGKALPITPNNVFTALQESQALKEASWYDVQNAFRKFFSGTVWNPGGAYTIDGTADTPIVQISDTSDWREATLENINIPRNMASIPLAYTLGRNSSSVDQKDYTQQTVYINRLPIALGGTGGITGEEARTNLAVPYLADFNDLVARVEALETANASLLQANNTLKAQNASLIADIQAGKTKRIYENADFDEEAYKERIKPIIDEEEIEEEE